MHRSRTIITEGEGSEADRREIERFLIAFNRSVAGPSGYAPFSLVLRDNHGRFLGGAAGSSFYGWTFVEMMAVAPEARGRGHGRELMEAVEDLARRRGCVGIWLDTYSFQAPDFHRKLGFVQCGSVPDFPPAQRDADDASALGEPAAGASLPAAPPRKTRARAAPTTGCEAPFSMSRNGKMVRRSLHRSRSLPFSGARPRSGRK